MYIYIWLLRIYIHIYIHIPWRSSDSMYLYMCNSHMYMYINLYKHANSQTCVYIHTLFSVWIFGKSLVVCAYIYVFFVSMSPVIQITHMKKLVGPASLLP